MAQLAVSAVPAHGGMGIAGFAGSTFWTALGTCILLKNVVNPFLMISAVERTSKAATGLLALTGTIIPAQKLLCIMHFVHLAFMAQTTGDRGECLVGTTSLATPKRLQVGVDMFTDAT